MRGSLPDPACTPGAVFPQITVAQLCVARYTSTVRNVTAAERATAYAAYGVTSRAAGEYELDHLVPLELGGSNEPANLWPEAAVPVPGYHEKDRLENWLHAEVCAGTLSLADAQALMATDWVSGYRSRFGG